MARKSIDPPPFPLPLSLPDTSDREAITRLLAGKTRDEIERITAFVDRSGIGYDDPLTLVLICLAEMQMSFDDRLARLEQAEAVIQRAETQAATTMAQQDKVATSLAIAAQTFNAANATIERRLLVFGGAGGSGVARKHFAIALVVAFFAGGFLGNGVLRVARAAGCEAAPILCRSVTAAEGAE